MVFKWYIMVEFSAVCELLYILSMQSSLGLNISYSEEISWERYTTQQCPHQKSMYAKFIFSEQITADSFMCENHL